MSSKKFWRWNRVSFSRVLAAVAALGLLACRNQTAPGPAARFAVLRFENLSGDKSLDWTGRAASEILGVALQSGMSGPVLRTSAVARQVQSVGVRATGAPGISAERSAALLAGANHLITGYVERAGALYRVTASEEDVSSGRHVRTFSATDQAFDAAVMKVASQFTPKPKPFLTTKAEAIQNYSAALDDTPDTGAPLFRKALAADPDFGPAWVASGLLDAVRSDRVSFTRTSADARQRKLDPFSRAQLDLQEATFNGDNKLRIAAMRKIVDLSPGDVNLLRSLAETETAAGDFKASAADWLRLTALMPGDLSAWNSLGYARSYAGDYPGALAAIAMYAQARPDEANPLDSMGDIHYSFGKFADAAAAYEKATQKNPDFERQAELYKAAWARFRAGDNAAADALMAKFRAAREKQRDALMPLLFADWLYRTGRAPQAEALLRQSATDSSAPGARMGALSQLVVWDLLAGDRAKASADLAAMGRPGNPPALIAAFSAMPTASAAEWDARAQRLFPGPAMQQLRTTAVGYALLLDGKRDAALPLWKQTAAANPGDFLPAEMVARLEGRKPALEPLPAPASVNQFRGVADKLSK